MAYNKNLYTSSTSALDAGIVYDQTETKMQSEVNAGLKNTLNHLEDGLAIIVNGDTCTTAVPVGGYAYIKNNTHGLAEGLYTNTSASVFPTSGGTATSSVFTPVSGGGLNSLKNSIMLVHHHSGQLDTSGRFLLNGISIDTIVSVWVYDTSYVVFPRYHADGTMVYFKNPWDMSEITTQPTVDIYFRYVT